jgi:uncharacterized protein (DUF2235 family)
VQKIFDCILKRDAGGVRQIKFYDEGVGAQGSFITRLLNGATGNGIDENILDIYKFIVWNYEHEDDDEDEIYLFGFSRGAYTARSLGGLIRKCGIIRKNDLNLIGEAYKLYRDKEAGPESDKLKKFRADNSYEVSKIKFIGVWDTVGARGIPLNIFQWYNRKRYSFYDTTLSSTVQYAYHAVAVDERRGNFEPTLWTRSDNKTERGFSQTLEQKWFAGVHSNVGGGYADERLSDITLKWMIDNARATGIALDEESVVQNVHPDVMGKVYNSKSGIFAWLPGHDRKVDEANTDDTVYEKIDKDPKYKPENVKPR